MPFPSIHQYPPELPAWRLEGHSLSAQERVAITPYEQGEDRHRERFTFTPWMCRVSTVLLQDQLDRFDEWFETDIQAGSQRFDTVVGGMAGQTGQWWQALFVGRYRLEAITDEIFSVTAELLLLDGPYALDAAGAGGSPGPRVSPSLSGAAYADGGATAQLDAPGLYGHAIADGEALLTVDISLYGRAEGDGLGELVPDGPGALLLDGAIGYLLLEGGTDRILLEP